LIEKKGEIQLQELKGIFPEVSMMTLRRDLISFEKDGIILRTYGGAVNIKKVTKISGDENPYYLRASENVEAKIEISKKALKFVEKGRSIYFDSGSTMMYLAERLSDDNFSIITGGLNIALELMKKSKMSIITLGGLVNRNTLSVSGFNTVNFLEYLNIDLAFMCATGFSIENGFTISNIYESELKRKVIKNAKKIIMIMDTSKINKNLPFTFAKLEDIDLWISEKKMPSEIIDAAKKKNVQLL
jgi:DeoR/GlpR family transcriptional regulator of sugar metabolism